MLTRTRRDEDEIFGRAIVAAVEERFRGEGVPAIRLGVLVANESALPFWHALGYRRVDLRPDRAKGRPAFVVEKALVLGKAHRLGS